MFFKFSCHRISAEDIFTWPTLLNKKVLLLYILYISFPLNERQRKALRRYISDRFKCLNTTSYLVRFLSWLRSRIFRRRSFFQIYEWHYDNNCVQQLTAGISPLSEQCKWKSSPSWYEMRCICFVLLPIYLV